MSDCPTAPPGAPDLGFCRGCARTVHGASFSDAAAYHAYTHCGLCQACQDVLPRSECAVERDLTAPVLHGVVLGATVEGTGVREAALLPFQFDPWYERFECEPGDIVHAGAPCGSADPLAELAAVRTLWDHRFERVLLLGSLDDPLLERRAAANHLVVALDGAAAAAAERLCPALRRPPLVDLSAALPWAAAFGAPLDALLRANAPDAGAVSALRQCALLVRLLERTAPAGVHQGCTVLEHVLFSITPPHPGAAQAPCDAPH